MAVNTPWGRSDSYQEETAGIKFYGTPSHGGYFIPKKLNETIPEYMRNENQWYEEDCDWCLPVIALGTSYFPHVSAENVIQAWDTFKNWHPAAYEKFTGVTLREGESYIRDDELFYARTQGQWVGVAAVGRDDGLVQVHACLGGRGKDGRYQSALRLFLVSKEEYDTRGRFGFVVDLDRHEEVQGLGTKAA